MNQIDNVTQKKQTNKKIKAKYNQKKNKMTLETINSLNIEMYFF